MNTDAFLRETMAGMLLVMGALSLAAGVFPQAILRGVSRPIERVFKPAIRVLAEDRTRFEKAERARCSVESGEMNITVYIGVFAMGMAVCTWFAWLPPSAAYALSLLFLVCLHSVKYVRMRQSYKRHVASLTVRSSWSLPPLFLVLACAVSALPMLYLNHPEDVLAAVLVSTSAFAMVALAYAVASLPPLLLGDDPEVEMAIDRSIRVNRAQRLLFMAGASLYVFASFTGIGNAMHWPIFWVMFVGVVSVISWTVILGRVPARVHARNA